MMVHNANSLFDSYNPENLFSLSGRTAMVIGVGGLGREAAVGLCAAGARLAVADIDNDRAESVAAEIRRAGGSAEAYRVNVTQKKSVEKLVERAGQDLGPVQAAVIAFGITRRGLPEEFDEADWRQIIDVNLNGTFLCCQAIGRRMLEQGDGSIILFSSIAGQVGLRNSPAYAASKGGVDQITRTFAIQWAERNVRVNAIAPSYFQTSMVAVKDDPELAELFRKRLELVPMARMGRPSELVGAIVFLASPAASMITGVVLPIDGGYLAQ
ncbi:MAG: SDR family oxidoreductase [Desulfobacterales bacterium]|jgi:NAD(P)-dependent dehydrogenase (short-subunit alcohol dehydrogenase family)